MITKEQEQKRIQLDKMVIVVAGLNLSGKTTISEMIAQTTNATIFDIDEYWRSTYGSLENRPAMAEVYKGNHARTVDILDKNKPALLVATYSQPHYHESLREFAKEQDCPVRFFLLSTPSDDELKTRLQTRLADSNNISDVVTEERVFALRDRYEAITNDPNDASFRVVNLDSSKPPTENLIVVINELVNLGKN